MPRRLQVSRNLVTCVACQSVVAVTSSGRGALCQCPLSIYLSSVAHFFSVVPSDMRPATVIYYQKKYPRLRDLAHADSGRKECSITQATVKSCGHFCQCCLFVRSPALASFSFVCKAGTKRASEACELTARALWACVAESRRRRKRMFLLRLLRLLRLHQIYLAGNPARATKKQKIPQSPLI